MSDDSLTIDDYVTMAIENELVDIPAGPSRGRYEVAWHRVHDASFVYCEQWGLDVAAFRAALEAH